MCATFDEQARRRPELYYRTAGVCANCFNHYTMKMLLRDAELNQLYDSRPPEPPLLRGPPKANVVPVSRDSTHLLTSAVLTSK